MVKELTLELEVYDEDGEKMLWIGTQCGSGCTYCLKGKSVGDIVSSYLSTYYPGFASEKREKITIPEKDYKIIQKYLFGKELLPEDSTIYYTTVFDDGMEMDVKCCGVQHLDDDNNCAWTEAVLFKDGSEIARTEVSDDLLGEWICYYNDTQYVTDVVLDNQ